MPPKDTVKLYLDELAIFKDPLYKEAARKELRGDPEKVRRYAKAGEVIERLLWTDASSNPERRKKLLLGVATIITYKGYRIASEQIKGNKAFVGVVFEETGLFGKDLGAAARRESRTVTYELLKTRKGWRIKDIDGILAKRGL